MAENKSVQENMFDTFLSNVDHVIKQVQDGESKERSLKDFDANAYWRKVGDVFKAVSHEATKLSLAYSKPPAPPSSHTQGMLGSAEKAVLNLIHVYSNLPKAAGLTLRKCLRESVKGILESLKSLVETIKLYEAGSTEQLQCTGIVWEGTDNFTKMPHDNKEAVMLIVDKTGPMIDDVYSELNDALNCDEDDEGLDEFLGFSGESSSDNRYQWSENDRNIVQYCLGLIKCTKSAVKKTKGALSTNGCCDTEERISEIDDLVDYTQRLSPAADELAAGAYPPFKNDVLLEKAADLKKANKDLIQFLKHSHLTMEDDQKWVEFLNRANNHNFSKISSILSGT